MRLVSAFASVAANTDVATLIEIRDAAVRRYDKLVLAETSGLPPFQRLAKSFRKHKERVCGYVEHKLTSGRIEGFNN